MTLADFDLHVFVTLTMTGLAQGSILALAALGFVLVYKASGVINFAQGQFLLIGAYVLWAAIVQWGLSPWLAVPVAIVVAFVLGLSVERLVLRPLVGQPVISVIMVTIGLAYILQGIVLWKWGATTASLPDIIPSKNLTVAGTTVGEDRLVAIGIVAVALVAFVIFFQRSKHGIAMRAVADDQQAALAMGISVRKVFALAWGLAGVSAVGGGILLADLTGVSLDLSSAGLLVFPVVILGGLDSVPGAVVGGAIIGLLKQYSGFYVNTWLSQWHVTADLNITGTEGVVPYIALVLILLFMPYGLFGQRRIERV
jgi:branched-chain amino acid transport system permease protein